MALHDIPNGGPVRRFDSWKEIADYLGRDVRTAIRWESQGLPVHRIPGGKGTSVFALSNEIDRWMSGRQRESVAAEATPLEPSLPSSPTPAASARRLATIGVITMLALSIMVVAFVVRGRAAANGVTTADLIVTPTTISIAVGSGAPRAVYTFQPDSAVMITNTAVRVTQLNHDRDADIIAGVAFYRDATEHLSRSGELLDLSIDGNVRWRFPVTDTLAFRDATFRGPWSVAAWESISNPPHSRIAVAAHDYVWWASTVAVLDAHGKRLSTFVNPGWIESLLWLSPTRLAVGGFNNQRNEAMAALIDPATAGGQAPGTAGTEFACAACPSQLPLFYATFPRSELNLFTGSPFNRASVSRVGDRILVTTSEIGTSPATAIYEFDREMRLVSARYSEPYWDLHVRLEREGQLTHTRDKCPERDGPRPIHVWDAAAGQWTAVREIGSGVFSK